VLAKLEWAKLAHSRRQIEDVVGIMKIRGDSLDRLYLEKWISQLELTKQWNEALRLAAR
jgi:hypothetical protein